MKNRNYIFPALLLIGIMSMSSCYVNRFTVGDGPVGKHDSKVQYSKTKQLYLFWGGIALGQSQPIIPQYGGYQVKSSFNFWDLLVGSITGGIFDMRTVKVYVRPDVRGPERPAHLER